MLFLRIVAYASCYSTLEYVWVHTAAPNNFLTTKMSITLCRRINTMLVRSLVFVTMVLALTLSSQAAVIVKHDGGTPLGATGLSKFVVYVETTAGEKLSALQGFNVTGNVHQVWNDLTNGPTPLVDNTAPGSLWNAAWTEYDTHILLGAADRQATFNAVTELNDGSSAVVLPGATAGNARKGFGTLTNGDQANPYLIIPSDALQNVEPYQPYAGCHDAEYGFPRSSDWRYPRRFVQFHGLRDQCWRCASTSSGWQSEFGGQYCE